MAEADARGRVADIYSDIRIVLGIPVVNLVYRTLAVDPRRLEEIWNALRPNLTSRVAAEEAIQLVRLARPWPGEAPSETTLAPAYPDAEDLVLARATLDAYARGNSRNLLAMHVLLDGCEGTGGAGDAGPALAPRAILPMARLDTLAPETLDLLRAISTSLVGDEEPVLVPSLLRHFAGSPPLLDFVWRTLQPALPRIPRIRETLLERARECAAQLPFPSSPLPIPEERSIAGRFAAAMATLLVAGEALTAALDASP